MTSTAVPTGCSERSRWPPASAVLTSDTGQLGDTFDAGAHQVEMLGDVLDLVGLLRARRIGQGRSEQSGDGDGVDVLEDRVWLARHRGRDSVPHLFRGPPFTHPAVLDAA